MLAVPVAAEPFIAQYQLGTPKQIYKSAAVVAIIFGSFFIIFAVFWMLVALFITGSALFFTGLLSAQTSPMLPDSPFPPVPPLIDPTLSTIMTILGLVFPLFGLIFVAVGITMIVKAILNRHVCAVLCEHGVVYLGRKESAAFRWEQVVTVLDKVSVNTSTSTSTHAGGMTSTHTTTSHAYTVVCKDGRRFLFDRKLARVEELGQEIQIAVALSGQQTI